jgi:hypothetical protein
MDGPAVEIFNAISTLHRVDGKIITHDQQKRMIEEVAVAHLNAVSQNSHGVDEKAGNQKEFQVGRHHAGSPDTSGRTIVNFYLQLKFAA